MDLGLSIPAAPPATHRCSDAVILESLPKIITGLPYTPSNRPSWLALIRLNRVGLTGPRSLTTVAWRCLAAFLLEFEHIVGSRGWHHVVLMG